MNILTRSRPAAAPQAEVDPPADELPTLRTVSPRFALLSDRYAALHVREEEIFAELGPLNERLRIAGAYSSMAQIESVEIPAAPVSQRAKEAAAAHQAAIDQALDGVDIPPPPASAPKRTARNGNPDYARAMELARELEAIRTAIELIRPELERERIAASRELCKLRAPEYSAVASRVTAALLELGNAMVDHATFERSMRGVAWSFLKPLQLPVGVRQDEPLWEIRRLLTWAAECGHFEMATIPHTWRSE